MTDKTRQRTVVCVEKKIKLIEPMVGDEELSLVKEVLESGYMTEGPKAREFESGFAELVGAKHAITTTSCSTALQICIDAYGVGPGDEVIVPDFTYPVTADVVRLRGGSAVLVDVSESTYNIDSEEVRNALTDKTKGIMPVSLFGHPVDMGPLREIAEENGLFIVEDAACSAGARYGDERTGSMADMTCFSFHPRKVITTGEGGMVTTDDDELAEKAREMKKFGMKVVDGKWQFMTVGTNYKLSDVLAAIGVVQLKKIDTIIGRRRELASIYDGLLRGNELLKRPEAEDGVFHIYQTYATLLTKENCRDRLIKDMAERGIETQIGTYSLHVQPSFSNVRRVGDLKHSTNLFKNLFALPMSNSMTPEDQEFVVNEATRLLESY
jgi:dTDP-4-amino-4,6-dideoxygalactose transaminase